jgi:prolipoprotein diacylglyceryltransferase
VKPVLYVAGLRLPAYTLFLYVAIALAVILGIHASTHHVRAARWRFVLIALLMALCAIPGARLLSLAVEPNAEPPRGLWDALLPGHGMAFLGGALLAGVVGTGASWMLRVQARQVLDASVPSVLLALAVGRIGCQRSPPPSPA